MGAFVLSFDADGELLGGGGGVSEAPSGFFCALAIGVYFASRSLEGEFSLKGGRF